MVYRGKPSAGCENCRKAKKRCGLEQPACSRCVKLKKICSGYRDTTQLQIQDESESVKLKVNRHKPRTPLSETHGCANTTSTQSDIPAPLPPGRPEANRYTPASDSSEEMIELRSEYDKQTIDFNVLTFDDLENVDLSLHSGFAMPFTLKPHVDDVATAYFFEQFTSYNGQWAYLREQAARGTIGPMVDIAIRACGMAALDNVRGLQEGRDYTRSLYAEAISQLNAALRDPKRCKTNEALIAVSLLAYYENLSCDCRQSIQSWKAHITGATQLLKIRGKNQFRTMEGRLLFRETRSSILIHCIWDDLEPPAFLLEWEEELNRQTPDRSFIGPADDMVLICYDFATLRSQMQRKTISDADAARRAAQIEMSMVDWSVKTMTQSGEAWTYYEVKVPESPHVWNGVVHAYRAHPAPTVWNTYRNMRILLTRTQELLLHRFNLPQEQRDAQVAYFRSVRRQMTDDICAGIPTQLGHASPAYNSPCVLMSAYASIWPLFFASMCVLERIGPIIWKATLAGHVPAESSDAALQARWLIDRLNYISKEIGLRWAEGVAATLRGDFNLHEDLQAKISGPSWVTKFDSRMLIERRLALSDALRKPNNLSDSTWLGKAAATLASRGADLDQLHSAKLNGWPVESMLGTINVAGMT